MPLASHLKNSKYQFWTEMKKKGQMKRKPSFVTDTRKRKETGPRAEFRGVNFAFPKDCDNSDIRLGTHGTK